MDNSYMISNQSLNTSEADGVNNTTESNIWLRYSVSQLLHFYSPVAYFTQKYLSLVWIMLGMPGNVLAFIVWMQPRLRTSSGYYLAIGAIVDLLLIIYRLSKAVQRKYGYNLRDVNGLCQILTTLHFMCQYAHTLLILGFSVERCIAVCYPLQRARLCTKSRALKVILFLMFTAVLIALPQSYFWHISEFNQCDYRLSVVKGGMASVLIIWSYVTEILLFVIVPLVTLSINTYVIKTLHVKRHKKLQSTVLHYFPKKRLKRTTTCTLLTTSVYDMLAELLVTVVYIIWPLFKTGQEIISDEELKNDAQWQVFLAYKSVRFIIENIFWSRYACNFYIYLATGQIFRSEFLNLFKVCRRKPTKDARTSYTMYTSNSF